MLMRFMAAAVACCAALSQGAIVEVAPVESNATPVVCAPGYASAGLMRSPESELAKFQSALDAGEFCMIGEFGCRPDVPHDVALAWMEHCLKLWKEKNLGWALWNLRGTFGILDSGRKDVHYEDFNGHKLDSKMLELLKRY